MTETNGALHEHPNAELLKSATRGFDFLFSNDIDSARQHFEQHDDPFHLMGLGVCAFLEAALGMESGLMTEASRCLALSEAGTRKQMRAAKPKDILHHSRFHYGLEWEILNADAIVLLGLTHALGESYMGYLQCMYSLNSAHSKFTKLYKTVFPNGLPQNVDLAPPETDSPSFHIPISPSLPTNLVHKPSKDSISSASTGNSASTVAPAPAAKGGFFSRWVSSSAAASSTPALPLKPGTSNILPDGPVEDLIVAGTAFGFGLFNLVFSLLPKKIQGLVGFLGFKHDRKLALQALSLSATKQDVHGVFAGLVLMTYHGVVLLMSGFQANEDKILAEYKAIVDRIETRYPDGALWILNRAKIMRMAYDAEGAIKVLQEGLKPDRPHAFGQADTLLLFELAWTLLSQKRYKEAGETFLKITELNSWSHGTYYFIAAGELGSDFDAQKLLDVVPDLIDKKKIGGKDLPTEVFIKKKLAFWKEKQVRKGGDESKFVEAISINPAEEIGIFWNNHARITPAIAQAHIDHLLPLTPAITPESLSALRVPLSAKSFSSTRSSKAGSKLSLPLPSAEDDLDTHDELAIRALLLGINYRTLGNFETSRMFLNEAYGYQNTIKISTWVGGVAMFELAVLDLKEAEARDRSPTKPSGKEAPLSDSNGSANVPVARAPNGLSKKLSKLTLDLDKPSSTPTAPAQEANPPTHREPEPAPLSEAERKSLWAEALKSASARLETALSLATSSVDLSSRLDSRITMLRDEIALKRDIVGVSV
ncbi:hypothetical protein D9613_012532 [Agrocybe pediades]|uniref:Mitochondrial outer membrane protein IML2 n=1 Tax=Agrocybe pediades TaxID=84607 RepID=A0A8H4VPJ9_9AGAR|nr:hypothetical protein D9613_012532 [Agrocybe pediades]